MTKAQLLFWSVGVGVTVVLAAPTAKAWPRPLDCAVSTVFVNKGYQRKVVIRNSTGFKLPTGATILWHFGGSSLNFNPTPGIEPEKLSLLADFAAGGTRQIVVPLNSPTLCSASVETDFFEVAIAAVNIGASGVDIDLSNRNPLSKARAFVRLESVSCDGSASKPFDAEPVIVPAGGKFRVQKAYPIPKNSYLRVEALSASGLTDVNPKNNVWIGSKAFCSK